MVETTSELAATVRRRWQDIAPRARALSLDLWARPELGLLEQHASQQLTQWLTDAGFTIERGVGGLPTAFVASSGSGTPVVGVLAEYDALPSLSNEAVPARRPMVPAGPGHGCGHNLIGTANIAAAIAAAQAREDLGLDGKVVVYGTPAEEIVLGKVVMLDAGAFDGADVLLTHHADYQNAAVSRPCQSIIHLECSFRGQPAHTGMVRAHNALDAAELLVLTLERLRAHQFPDVGMEHVYRFPQIVMPSATPEEVRAWFYLRAREYERAAEVFALLAREAEHAAAAVGVTVDVAVVSSCRGYLPNDVLGRLLSEQLQLVGPPQWDDNDLTFQRELARAFSGSDAFHLDRELSFPREGLDAYGQDDGEVSWFIPLGRVNYAVPAEIPLHSWAATSLFGSPAAWKGAAMVSEALALAATSLLARQELIEAAREELHQRVPQAVERTMRGEWGRLLAMPEGFWNATW